jgi:hypothetical protein
MKLETVMPSSNAFLRNQANTWEQWLRNKKRRWSNLISGFTSRTFATKAFTLPVIDDTPSAQTLMQPFHCNPIPWRHFSERRNISSPLARSDNSLQKNKLLMIIFSSMYQMLETGWAWPLIQYTRQSEGRIFSWGSIPHNYFYIPWYITNR